MRDVSVADLTEDQQNILFSSTSKPLAVKGVAGSGKTILAVKRINQILKNDSLSKILFIVFNKPMERYLNTFFQSDNVTINTFHGFYYDNFNENAGFNWGQIISKLENNKNIFDKFKYLFIDECQDFALHFYRFIKNNTNLIINIFGDDSQKIRENKNNVTDIFIELDIDDRVNELKTNFRNTINVVSVASKFISNIPKDYMIKKKGHDVVLNEYKSKEEELNFIRNICTDFGSHNSIGVIVPTIDHIEYLYSKLKNINNVSVKRYHSNLYTKNEDEYNNFNINPEKNIYILTYHSCKGLEFDYIILPFLNKFNVYSQERDYNKLYVAMTRTRYKGKLYLSYHNPFNKPSFIEKIIDSNYLIYHKSKKDDKSIDDSITF